MRRVMVGVCVLSLLLPVPTWSVTALGTARGVRTAQLSMDGGKSWLPLSGRSLPVIAGTEIRSTSGTVFVDLNDGSRIHVLPFTALRLTTSQSATELSLSYGRLVFRFPERTRVEVATSSARLVPMRGQPMAGEVFAGGPEIFGLKMTEGRLHVRSLAEPQRVVVAGLEPVFLPRRPYESERFFNSDPPTPILRNAIGVFAANGESLGYLDPDGDFIIAPGFTRDLTGPYPAKLVQLAIAKIPNNARDDALPLFDVNGTYVGYIAGPVFYAQDTQDQPQEPAEPPTTRKVLRFTTFGKWAVGAAVAVGVAVGGAVAIGGSGGGGGGGGGGGSPAPSPGPSATRIGP